MVVDVHFDEDDEDVLMSTAVDDDNVDDYEENANVAANQSKDYSSVIPWVEKYRPKSISEVQSQSHVVSVLEKSLSSVNGIQQIPHLLFYGPAGTGKTSTILALCKDLFGVESYKSRVLELNASDERGIQVVRDKIKNFARLAVAPSANSKVPTFKVIILDEADSMTPDAQSALRRTMEVYSKVTRFCLICNYVSRIIEPLASRCAKFRFKPLPLADSKGRLQFICEKEGISIESEALDTLIESVDGDLRRAITLLQSASHLSCDSADSTITKEQIESLNGSIPSSVMTRFSDLLFAPSTTFSELLAYAQENIIQEGYPVDSFIRQWLNILLDQGNVLSKVQQSIILIRLAKIDYGLVTLGDEQLQLNSLLADIWQIIKLKKVGDIVKHEDRIEGINLI